MPRTITRTTAERAVDAWMRRLLPAPNAGHRPDGSLTAYDHEVTRVRQRTRDSLIRVLADVEVDDELAKEPRLASQLLARQVREHSSTLASRLIQLERTVGRSSALWRRYRPLIVGFRKLSDPGSDSAAALAREICLDLSLRAHERVPWARRI